MRKYFSAYLPSRLRSGPPQPRHSSSWSCVGGASARTTLYSVWQVGQWTVSGMTHLCFAGRFLSRVKGVVCVSDKEDCATANQKRNSECHGRFSCGKTAKYRLRERFQISSRMTCIAVPHPGWTMGDRRRLVSGPLRRFWLRRRTTQRCSTWTAGTGWHRKLAGINRSPGLYHSAPRGAGWSPPVGYDRGCGTIRI